MKNKYKELIICDLGSERWNSKYNKTVGCQVKGLSDRKDLVDLEKLIREVPKSTFVERSFQHNYILRDKWEIFYEFYGFVCALLPTPQGNDGGVSIYLKKVMNPLNS